MIYLDHNATTPVDERVLAAMLPFFGEQFGNPSSLHASGTTARAAVDSAREQVAQLVNCRPAELVFTSGATEALNTAIRGLADSHPEKRHLVATAVEHKAVLGPLERLAERGYELTLVPVDGDGRLDVDALTTALRDDTLLVAAMLANNETGVQHPVRAIADICKGRNVPVPVVCDATAVVGREPVDIRALGADVVAFSAHKFHGPKGAGALVVRRGTTLEPLLVGGPQERDRRAGTENVPAIVGFGAAASVAADRLADGTYDRVREQRNRLESALLAAVPDARANGQPVERLGTTASVSFPHVNSEALLQQLEEAGIVVSSSSACQANVADPSHVLRAMQVPESHIHGTIRFSLGRGTTADDIDRVIAVVPPLVYAAQGLAGPIAR